METTELLTSLAKLETSLQEIESAKKQVKQTVDAYSVLQGQIKAYTDSLESIKESVEGLVSELRTQRATLGEEASGLASALEEKSAMLFSKISESSSDILNTLKAHLDAANELFTKDSKAIAEYFKNSTDDELAKLQKSVQTLNECATTFNTLDESIKSALSQIEEVRKEIAELKNTLLNSQNSQDEILKQIQDNIISLSQRDEQALLDLSKSVESSKEMQLKLSDGIKKELDLTSKKQEQALLDLSKNVDSSKEMQVKLSDGIKKDIDLIYKKQEQAFSLISGSLESIKKENESSLSKIEGLFKSNSEESKQLGSSIMKENHLLRILLIVNILLAIGLAVLF